MSSRIVVFGATGGTGRALVRQALAQGRTVTAVGRDEARLRAAFADVPDGSAVVPVVGDVADGQTVARAVQGQDVVFDALGPRKGDDPAALTEALRQIVHAMQRSGPRRLLLVSGAGIRVAGDRKPLPDRIVSALVRRLNRRDVEEKEAQLALLVRTPQLDWTVVRPPRLVDRPGTGKPLAADPHTIAGGRMVPYADLAAFLLREADERRFVRRSVFVAAG